MILLASLAWEEASQSQSHRSRSHRRCHHRRRRRPPRPHPPTPGPPSLSSTEDYNQKTSCHQRRCSPRRSGGKAIRPRWTMGCLETWLET